MSLLSTSKAFPHPDACAWVELENGGNGVLVGSYQYTPPISTPSEDGISQNFLTTQNGGIRSGYLALYNFDPPNLKIADIFKFDRGVLNLDFVKTQSENFKNSNIFVTADSQASISLFKM